MNRSLFQNKKIYVSLLAMFCAISLRASDIEAWVNTTQKFPVVIGVLFIIFIGLILFLLRIEKRIKRLEETSRS